MSTVSFENFSKGAPVSLVSTATPEAPTDSGSSAFSDFSAGFVKGGIGSAVGTARLLQSIGQRAISILPGQNYDNIKKTTGFESLKGPATDAIDNELASKNKMETAGKTVEFLAELLYPGGKTNEGKAIINKGRSLVDGLEKKAGATIEDIGTKVMDKTKDIPDEVRTKAINLFSNLDDKTKTALQRTPMETFKEFVDIGKRALKDDSVVTPIEHVGQQVVDGLKTVTKKLRDTAIEKGNYLYKSDLWTKSTGNIVKDAVSNLETKFQNIALDSSDAKFVDRFKEELTKLGENPNLGKVDQVIDLLQDKAYKAAGDLVNKKTSRILGPLREVIGELNTAVKDIGGPEYTRLVDETSRYTRLVNGLNKRLGSDGAGAGSFVKRLFSPSDANTKKYFDALQKETGVDYFRNARLAKFTMEALGDTRAQSLLEQVGGKNAITSVPTDKKAAISRLVEYVTKKTGINDPIRAAEEYLKKNGPKVKKVASVAEDTIKKGASRMRKPFVPPVEPTEPPF